MTLKSPFGELSLRVYFYLLIYCEREVDIMVDIPTLRGIIMLGPDYMRRAGPVERVEFF